MGFSLSFDFDQQAGWTHLYSGRQPREALADCDDVMNVDDCDDDDDADDGG